MLKPSVVANSIAVVSVVAFVVCGLVAYVAPELLFGIAQSWFHSINLELVRAAEPMDMGTFLFGVLSFGVYMWLVAYAFAAVYNLSLRKL